MRQCPFFLAAVESARSVGANIVAEGIETAGQLEFVPWACLTRRVFIFTGPAISRNWKSDSLAPKTKPSGRLPL
jgi:EAL domain-containing protein (putative c-di-GMP-specific phosphodiesterase class I)